MSPTASSQFIVVRQLNKKMCASLKCFYLFLILFTYCFEQCRISPISLFEYPASRSLKIRE